MRFDFDPAKNRSVKRKHGVGLEEPAQIFDQAYIVDRKKDDPKQFRAIGWCGDRLCSVIFEVRHDESGEFLHLITAWRASKEEEQAYAGNI